MKTEIEKKKFLIYSPPFDPNSGGAIVLHKLCDLINRSGRQAFLYPLMPSFELHPYNSKDSKKMIREISEYLINSKAYAVSPDLHTPVLAVDLEDQAGEDLIVVYPEIVFGNPLRSPNVVRWMLHVPGFHTGNIYFGHGELHFYYGSALRKFEFPECKASEIQLAIEHSPYKLYLNEETSRERHGTAYCIRKGKDRPIEHDLTDSILIDGKSHEEIAKIFKSVKTFISYDIWTAYSRFASIAGCDSVVMPLKNLSIEQWGPELSKRMGIAYGFDDICRARETREQLVNHYLESDKLNMQTTGSFINECDSFFFK